MGMTWLGSVWDAAELSEGWICCGMDMGIDMVDVGVGATCSGCCSEGCNEGCNEGCRAGCRRLGEACIGSTNDLLCMCDGEDGCGGDDGCTPCGGERGDVASCG